MYKEMLMIVLATGALGSCDFRDSNTVARNKELDSLRQELQLSQKATQTLQDVGLLIDSIDANRKTLRTKMIEGLTYDNFIGRMKDINRYVIESEKKIGLFEKSVHSSRPGNASYAAALKKLRNDLDIRTHEITALQEQVERYKGENATLIHELNLREAEIDDKLAQIKSSQDKVSTLEDQLKEMVVQKQASEAEAYFNRGEALELAASRTKFAPRKKKNTQRQALEMYKMALFYGKIEAQEKILRLEKVSI